MINTLFNLWSGLWTGIQSVTNILSTKVAGIALIDIIFGIGISTILGFILVKWVLNWVF